MTTPTPIWTGHDSTVADDAVASCNTDRSCGCGPATAEADPGGATGARSMPKRGLMAALLAGACAVACLAFPLVVAGAAALSGAVAGGWWLGAGAVVGAAVVAVAVVRRRRC